MSVTSIASEVTTIEFNRFLVESQAKEAAVERKRVHEEERKLRQELKNKYQSIGASRSAGRSGEMSQAKVEVEHYHADNLAKGTGVKEEVKALLKQKEELNKQYLQHGSELAKEYGSEQKRRIKSTIGELTATKTAAAKAQKEGITELERVRTERKQKELEDAQKLKREIMEKTSDAMVQQSRQVFFDQRKGAADDTRSSAKVWKESRSNQKEQYATKAQQAKAEALQAKKAAKEAIEGVRAARAQAASEMREKRQNIETNFTKVKGDLGKTKKQVHDMTRTRKFVSPEAAAVMRQQKT